MEINQVTRMIEWLDEERRRDKAKIAKLEERLGQQQEFIETITRRQNNLEGDQAGMKTQFIPSARDSELVEQIRNEIHQTIEALEAKRFTAERESERRAEVARDGILRPVREVSDRLEKVERSLDEIGVARVERDRFAAALAALQQRVEDLAKKGEEPDRRLSFLEEQRRQDARRISETQTELPEIQKQIDSLKPKLDLIETLALRNEKLVLDLQSNERDRREQIQGFVEQQALSAQQREQRIDEVIRSFGQYDEEMRRSLERFETWSEAYRQMKKVIEDFERIGERLERRINEVAEMQRLSEERFRQEWNSWISDDQKRWRQFTLTNDDTWRTHDKEFEQFRARFNEGMNMFVPLNDNVERLWRFLRAQSDLFRERFLSMLVEYDPASDKLRAASSSSSTNGRG